MSVGRMPVSVSVGIIQKRKIYVNSGPPIALIRSQYIRLIAAEAETDKGMHKSTS